MFCDTLSLSWSIFSPIVKIKTFTPEPFWSIDVCVDVGGRMLRLEWTRRRVFDEEVASLCVD